MTAVLLTILKIIGIVLLVILGIMLFLLAVLLFVPDTEPNSIMYAVIIIGMINSIVQILRKE